LRGLGRRTHFLNLIVLIGWKILIGQFTEESVPVGAVEVGELSESSLELNVDIAGG
jgi:hypothetical protein